jgi:hypothetical protein
VDVVRKGYSVIKRISLLIAAAFMALTLAAPAAFAASPSQEQCEASGGEFDRVNGKVICVKTEEGKNPKFTEETTTTGQGNSGNKPTSDSDCEGTGSDKCPPGQFK